MLAQEAHRARILVAIDEAHGSTFERVTAWEIHKRTPLMHGITSRTTARELRAMSKANIVVYDRKASGWRRA